MNPYEPPKESYKYPTTKNRDHLSGILFVTVTYPTIVYTIVIVVTYIHRLYYDLPFRWMP